MLGEDVREVFEAVLPDEALVDLIRDAKLQQRARKLDPVRLVRSAVIASARGDAGRQVAMLETYFQAGGQKVVRGAAYGWFSPAFERTMDQVARRALAHARAQKPDLPGLLGKHVVDWHAYDSTTVRLDDELREAFPGTGSYAAIKVHKRYSIGVGTTVDYKITAAREHDAPHLVLDESWRGHGLLVDLGYASHALLRDAETFDVRYVIRLKESWKPKVTSIVAGDVRKTFVPGADFDLLLDEEVLALSGASIDVDVTLGPTRALRARLVGVQHQGTYRYFLTNLPRSVSPEDVARLYRVRWEIELDNKLDKSNFHLDEIQAKTPHTVRALVHASITASVITCVIAHAHRIRETPPKKRNTPRTKPPIHVHALARSIAASADRIADTLALAPGPEADAAWDAIAQHLTYFGFDPNWRHRPSELDQLRGWLVQPAKSRGGGRKKRDAANLSRMPEHPCPRLATRRPMVGPTGRNRCR